MANKLDDTTTLTELRDFTNEFCTKREWNQFHTAKDMGMNAIIEIGEMLDHFRFRTEDEIKILLEDKDKKRDIAQEYSDAFYSMLRLADLLDIDMTTELKSKMQLISQKYPVSKAKGTNKKYNEL